MVRITKDVEYALLSLDAVAREGRLLSARDIAERHGIPLGILMKILQRLARAELLVSVQGAKGGYLPAKPLNTVSLAAVFEAVHGPFSLAACLDDAALCDQGAQCSIREGVGRLQHAVRGYLASTTVADLVAPAPQPQPVEGEVE